MTVATQTMATKTAMRRLKTGDLDLSIFDPFERDIQYIFDEIFVGNAYDHPKIKLAERPVIIDVGANVGLFTIWAARKYNPRAIYSYEASPTTHLCLVDNSARHIDPATTKAVGFNRAVSFEPGKELLLHQPPWNSGLSTILDGTKLDWVEDLRGKGELITHKVPSTSVSHEIAKHKLATVDLLKIDVEGYFMEVLAGIAPADFPKIKNIVLEAEYTERLGHTAASLSALLHDKGYETEAQDAAQIMIYAWRG
jgi:FkbM family methyltransferase